MLNNWWVSDVILNLEMLNPSFIWMSLLMKSKQFITVIINHILMSIYVRNMLDK